MTLILTAEEESLRDSVRRFVADRSPLTKVRDLIAAGEPYDAEVWKQLAAQLGLAGLIIPAEYGGAGAGWSALSTALTELGAGLVPSPLLAVSLAAGVLLQLDDDGARDRLLPGIAAGDLIVTLAAVADGGQVITSGDGDDLRLSGELSPVLNGAQADAFLIPARRAGGTVLCLADREAAGLTVTPLTTADHTRALARLRLDGAPARPLAGDGPAALAAAGDLVNLALAAEQCGGMAACLAMTAEYAKIRVAFGQPIGAFQAVKHKLADMATARELAYAALRAAADCAGERPGKFPAAASVARVTVSAAYFEAAADTIQLHGGIGYTWEHDAHLYYKNALSGKVLFGDPGAQLDRLAATLRL
ncbi:MAG: acyl-CoA dehydrogenase family protein [Streptosporangiaceae bacterium]|jgi:alkylation response protein AidB-like acyl-CoA dehydrogenase|nr:acyl-CoA dehydrogenase [Actinomycetota bacterium]